MRIQYLLTVSVLACSAAARSVQHARKSLPEMLPKGAKRTPQVKRDTIIPQNSNTTRFAVDGAALPDVDFDAGESYAGRLPISNAANASELWFWFWPSENPAATDEILIWFNGCSSLEGFLQENGPFLWQPGTYRPVRNPWSWTNLTNVVWVEHAADTGYSKGPMTAKNEEDIATQFAGWYKNFVDTFGLHGRKIYLTGESFAGYYVPYVADFMLNANDTDYYNVESILIYDPSTSYDVVQTQIPAVPYVDYWAPIFNLNSTFMADIHARAESCGYSDFFNTYMTFPPPGPMPTPDEVAPGCDLWDDIFAAASLSNPCFNVYEITTGCPLLWDVLGFPGSSSYTPPGASVYFNRSDVQAAIHAPQGEWSECANSRLSTDDSLPSGVSVLPGVIERTNRSIIAHGDLDYILIGNGTLLMIQNMTWNGAQGFSEAPSKEFFVPYHSEATLATLTGSGVMGKWHTERGLTWVQNFMAGHEVPQYQAGAAYRQLEYVLGRIDSLDERSDFTTQSGDFGNNLNYTGSAPSTNGTCSS